MAGGIDRAQDALDQPEAAVGGEAPQREALGRGETEWLGDGHGPVDELVAIAEQGDLEALAGEALDREHRSSAAGPPPTTSSCVRSGMD